MGDGWTGPRAEVTGLLREGGAYGALTMEQTKIIERVMNLSEVRVGSIMVPRRKVTVIPLDITRSDFLKVISSRKYSRLPVTRRDGNRVVGIVNVHHVLADEAGFSIERHMQRPLTLRANGSAANALVQLQQTEQTMAFVADPRRGDVGIVTLKDVVEEIFGELSAW